MHFEPKKRLGQNFLVDKNIQRKIIAACEFNPADIVLEIGAGRGELTGLIAQRVNKIYALEIDTNLCKSLMNNLKSYSNVEVIKQDILKFNLKKYFSATKDRIKVIGNIPYYISSPIIGHLLKTKDKIDTIFITVQKEFAKRIAAQANSKDYSSFTCFVQYYCQPKIMFAIKKTCFFPKPKVDSSFVRLRIRLKPCVRPENEKMFFKTIRAAFNKRRKTLRNSLRGIVSAQKLERFFNKYGIDPNTRPENLSLENFANLTNI